MSLKKEEYALYKKEHKLQELTSSEVIDEIVINNPTYISDDVIADKLSVKVGDAYDGEILREDILHIYNMGVFDEIKHTIVQKNGKNILEITTTPSWDNHGEIRFALGLEDDFDGHSAYSLKFGYTMFGLNKYGGEWKNDFEIGRRKKAYTEFFQPLNSTQNFYFKSSLSYEKLNELLPVSTLVNTQNQGLIEVEAQRYGTTVAFGTHMFRGYELEVGASVFQDSTRIELLNGAIADNNARPIYASLKIDNLDNLNFPTTGSKLDVTWTKEIENLGSDYDYEQVSLDLEKPFNYKAHNITTYLKYGTTYKQDKQMSIAGSFNLGGLFNLSGYVPYSLVNENVFLGVLKYRYQLKSGGFFGSLNAPLYAGFSAEIGNTWGYGDSVSYDMMHKSGTVYIAADTILGPIYFAYGFSDSKNRATYLYLGEKF